MRRNMSAKHRGWVALKALHRQDMRKARATTRRGRSGKAVTQHTSFFEALGVFVFGGLILLALRSCAS